jgi:hypothetical protein
VRLPIASAREIPSNRSNVGLTSTIVPSAASSTATRLGENRKALAGNISVPCLNRF